jgi:hypothetical protein
MEVGIAARYIHRDDVTPALLPRGAAFISHP